MKSFVRRSISKALATAFVLAAMSFSAQAATVVPTGTDPEPPPPVYIITYDVVASLLTLV